jgi:hypothetical protein
MKGGTKFHFTVRSNLLAIILRLVHLESKPERMLCFCSGGAEISLGFRCVVCFCDCFVLE